MRIDFVTIFPRMFDPFLAEGVIARGIKQGLIDVRIWDLREFATDKHRSTDDEAYGGGPGMVMLAEPVLRAAEEIGSGHIVMTSPKGRRFDQNIAQELLSKSHVVFLCGRYEGFDERVREVLQPEELSIGDFVVSGGELPAMVMADAIGRLVEGVVGNADSVVADSFFGGLLDHPHYTRPEEIRGLRVPEVCLQHEMDHLNGVLFIDHLSRLKREMVLKKLAKWRKEQALRETLQKRPDLLKTAALDDEAREILRRIENEK